jgi:hypothetical protein
MFLHAGQHLIAVFSQPPDRLRIMLRVVASICGQRSRDVDALLDLAFLVARRGIGSLLPPCADTIGSMSAPSERVSRKRTSLT